MWPHGDVSTLHFSHPGDAIVAWGLLKRFIWYAVGILHDEQCPRTDAASSNADQRQTPYDWAIDACRRTDAVWTGWRGLAESVFGIDAACIEQVRSRFPPDGDPRLIANALLRIGIDKAKERGWPIPHCACGDLYVQLDRKK